MGVDLRARGAVSIARELRPLKQAAFGGQLIERLPGVEGVLDSVGFSRARLSGCRRYRQPHRWTATKHLGNHRALTDAGWTADHDEWCRAFADGFAHQVLHSSAMAIAAARGSGSPVMGRPMTKRSDPSASACAGVDARR